MIFFFFLDGPAQKEAQTWMHKARIGDRKIAARVCKARARNTEAATRFAFGSPQHPLSPNHLQMSSQQKYQNCKAAKYNNILIPGAGVPCF